MGKCKGGNRKKDKDKKGGEGEGKTDKIWEKTNRQNKDRPTEPGHTPRSLSPTNQHQGTRKSKGGQEKSEEKGQKRQEKKEGKGERREWEEEKGEAR